MLLLVVMLFLIVTFCCHCGAFPWIVSLSVSFFITFVFTNSTEDSIGPAHQGSANTLPPQAEALRYSIQTVPTTLRNSSVSCYGQVPRRSESLLGQTLQAPLHVESSAQTTVGSDRDPELGFNGPQAVTVGGFAPLPHGLSRASRTRCTPLFC